MNITSIFATPLWSSQLPDFQTHKDSFLKCVNNFRSNNPEGNIKSNINGYQSPVSLTNEVELGPLFEFACQMGLKAAFDMQLVDCDVYVSAAWVNFNEGRNQFNLEHEHVDTFSGVFYLQIPEKSGSLSIVNPGMNNLWQGSLLVDKKSKFSSERLKIEPVEGSILLWPSYVTHSVLPNDHEKTRISISFNLICIPKELVPHTK